MDITLKCGEKDYKCNFVKPYSTPSLSTGWLDIVRDNNLEVGVILSNSLWQKMIELDYQDVIPFKFTEW